MTTSNQLLTDLRFRLNETVEDVWTDNELLSYIYNGITGLYPHFYNCVVGTSTASDGPIQDTPSAETRNIYQIGQVKSGATRVRPIRGWTEGIGEAVVPRLGIAGNVLVWSWTQGFDMPEMPSSQLDIPTEAEAVVVIRAQITALERLVTDRTKAEKYFAVQVRQGVSEQDILDTLDALHQTLKEHLDRAKPLPEKVG